MRLSGGQLVAMTFPVFIPHLRGSGSPYKIAMRGLYCNRRALNIDNWYQPLLGLNMEFTTSFACFNAPAPALKVMVRQPQSSGLQLKADILQRRLKQLTFNWGVSVEHYPAARIFHSRKSLSPTFVTRSGGVHQLALQLEKLVSGRLQQEGVMPLHHREDTMLGKTVEASRNNCQPARQRPVWRKPPKI